MKRLFTHWRSPIRRIITPCLFCLFLFSGSLLQAQLLIDPNAEGGFELGTTFAANGWTVVNNSPNSWIIGTVPPGFTNNSAYVSPTGSAGNWDYTHNNGPGYIHFWRDVVLPAGVPVFELNFDWVANGQNFLSYPGDGLMVSIVPTSYTPTAN